MIPLSVSIIVPVYNESVVLEKHLKEIIGFFNSINESFELIAVNDGSTDESERILRQLEPLLPSLRVVSYDANRGKGYAVRRGALEAKGEWILFMDADLSTPLREYQRLKDRADDASVIFGSRGLPDSQFLSRQPAHKQLLGKLGNHAMRMVLGVPFRDTQCGFKLFRREHTIDLFRRLTLERWGFDFELLYLALKKNLNVIEVPVTWKNDSTSTVRPLDYLKTFRDVFKVRLNDMRGRYDSLPE